MSDQLDPRIQVVLDTYGLRDTDFWEIKQKPGTWVAKHAALEVAAVKAGIVFDMPVIIEQNAGGLITSIIVQGVMGERTEWSIGETNPSNYHISGKQPSYPWAMAEKRAKDRVILKLIGIHGLVYSEDEMAERERDTAPERVATPPLTRETINRETGEITTHPKTPATRAIDGEMRKEIDACLSPADLRRFWRSKAFKAEMDKHPADWKDAVTDYANERFAEMEAAVRKQAVVPGYVEPNFDHLGKGDAS